MSLPNDSDDAEGSIMDCTVSILAGVSGHSISGTSTPEGSSGTPSNISQSVLNSSMF